MNLYMKNADDSTIPVWMWFRGILIFMRENHKICVCSGIEGILRSPHIVCCIIDPNNFMLVQAILDKCYSASISLRERMLISIVSYSKQSGKDVILKAREEIL